LCSLLERVLAIPPRHPDADLLEAHRPYCIRMEDESPFFIGGMWDVWHAREEDRIYTFTVLTTFPNEVSGTVHDR